MMEAVAEDLSERHLLDIEYQRAAERLDRRDPLRTLLEPPREAALPTFPEPLEDFFQYRSARLERALLSIDREIRVRFDLRDLASREIDYQIGEATRCLGEFSHWGLGYNVGVDVKRNFLERMLADLRRQKRHAEIATWSDIVSLRKERRKVDDELASLHRKENWMKE